MSEKRSRGKIIRHTILLASLCSSLYFAPELVERLRGGPSATDMLLTQYLPAEAKARLDEIEANGGLLTTDKGLDVPQCFVEVRPGGSEEAENAPTGKKVHTAGNRSSAGGARTVRGGS